MPKNNRARGRNRALAGKVKQGVGQLIGNQEMEITGAAEVIAGHAEETAAKTSERAVGVGQELSGNIKQAIGQLTNNPELAIAGQAEANSGKQRQEDNL